MRHEVFGVHCYHTSHAKIRQFGTCSYQNGLLVSWLALWRKFLPKCQFGKNQTLVWRNPPPFTDGVV